MTEGKAGVTERKSGNDGGEGTGGTVLFVNLSMGNFVFITNPSGQLLTTYLPLTPALSLVGERERRRWGRGRMRKGEGIGKSAYN